MTTSAAPRRTMLPPNLTRNYYEVKRLVAEADGKELPHWYQLTDEQKQAEELTVELFRRAILRAEEEQDLVASFNAPPAREPQATDEPTAAPENCECPGCSTVRALTQLIRQAKQLEATLGWASDGSGQGTTVLAFKPPTFITAQQADLQTWTNEIVEQWVAAGKPIRMSGWIPAAGVSLDGFGPTRFDWKHWGFIKPLGPQPFLRDVL
ncbi:hypothetical protein [Streptomyces chartreusis]|uniref:hypothetical protein n=1 Tax=Streptomyces chartreusis TaxID=1969 RepID=UPI0036B1B5E2